MMLTALIRGPSDGVLCPIPQYPLYSAAIVRPPLTSLECCLSPFSVVVDFVHFVYLLAAHSSTPITFPHSLLYYFYYYLFVCLLLL